MEIRSLLRDNILEVLFTKKDGSERRMICTTKSEFLPDMSGSRLSKPNEDIVTVWDIEADAWRSFKLDSIIDVKIYEMD